MTAQRNYTAKQWRHTQYASYFGYITQAIVNNLAPLLFLIFQDVYGIPLEKITLLVLVDMVAARFVDKIGYRPCIVAAHLFAAAGLAGLGLLPRLLPDPFVGLLGAVFLYAIGGGLIEVLISPIVEACPTDNKASVMSLLHSFYCWGMVAVVLGSCLARAAGRCWRCCGPCCPWLTPCGLPRCPSPTSPRRGRACPWASCSPTSCFGFSPP